MYPVPHRMIMLIVLIINGPLFAATADIANEPLANSGTPSIKPNILFVLDDSGSMDYEYMPDAAINNRTKNCFKNYLYNTIYYNPSKIYALPKNSDGSEFNNSTFISAKDNGYSSSSGTINLSADFRSYNEGNNDRDNAQRAYYYRVKSGITVNAGSCGSDSSYEKVTIAPGTTEAQNFANWYSYYRKRILLAKAAASFAFVEIDSDFRVGYTKINNKGTPTLDIEDFDSTQKSTFFSRLFATSASGYTPLRAALSQAGRYYAKKLSGQEQDPVQYSCQKNFTILSSDGYWNTDAESASQKFGPYELNGSSNVGDVDKDLATPYKDGLQQSNTLADIAAYYYGTDLRTQGLQNCEGKLGTGINVCSESNTTSFDVQNMSTYTIGLGVNGTLNYVSNYDSPATGDYLNIVNGTANWPDPFSTGSQGAKRIDDLWHAAVNGHGKYYSANNADDLADALIDSLSKIESRSGSSSAAATSNLEPVAGDNFVYVALYRTLDWYGDLIATTLNVSNGSVALRLDTTSGEPVAGTFQWSAKSKLAEKTTSTSDSRTIYFFDSSKTKNRSTFLYSNLNTTQQAYFSTLCGSTPKLSQCSDLTTAEKTLANSGTNVVNFLRGQRQHEGTATVPSVFRERKYVLGDIVNAVPVYVGKPPFSYLDAGYSGFASANASRTAMVYSAANDGMLHAFNATTGAEEWAYVPNIVMPEMYRLADKNYSGNHRYFVDGSPTLADVKISGSWRTVLVGGFNKGARGYYAIDVTTPNDPTLLWEFTDTNLGYTYGNPIVTKLQDGTWVALLSSGYNNVSSGDGNGRLYVVNIADGSIVRQIATTVSGNPAGDTTTPSGLAKLNVWIDNDKDNVAEYAYGGDMQGNVWRFDINAGGVTRLGVLKAGSIPQPITNKVEPARISYGGQNYRVIYASTGRYLGTTDLANTTQQTIYAFKESNSDLGVLRNRNDMVQQTVTVSGANRNGSKTPVDWTVKSGWYADLPTSGERVNIDMQQQLDTLTVASNVPSSTSVCSVAGGQSYIYYFNIKNGNPLSSNGNKLGEQLSTTALVAGIKTIRLPNGKTVTIVTDTGGGVKGKEDPSSDPGIDGPARRTSWRELID